MESLLKSYSTEKKRKIKIGEKSEELRGKLIHNWRPFPLISSGKKKLAISGGNHLNDSSFFSSLINEFRLENNYRTKSDCTATFYWSVGNFSFWLIFGWMKKKQDFLYNQKRCILKIEGNTSQKRTTDYAKESCPIKHGYKHLKIVKATWF